MRIFLPLVPADLKETGPPSREPVSLDVPPGLTADEIDVLHARALDDAAFRSLELLFESGADSSGAWRRIVAVGEAGTQGWAQFDAFYVDDDDGKELVEQAANASEQERLDTLVQEIFDTPLDWYDVSELPALRSNILGE